MFKGKSWLLAGGDGCGEMMPWKCSVVVVFRLEIGGDFLSVAAGLLLDEPVRLLGSAGE